MARVGDPAIFTAGYAKPAPPQMLSAHSLAALEPGPSFVEMATDNSDVYSEWSCCASDISEYRETRGLKLQQFEDCCESEEECHAHLDEGSTTAVSGDESLVSATRAGIVMQDISSESELDDSKMERESLSYSISVLLQYHMVMGSPDVAYTTRRIQDITGAVPRGLVRPSRTEGTDRCSAQKSEDDKYARMIRTSLSELANDRIESTCQKLAARGVKTPAQFGTLVAEIFAKGFMKHHLIPTCVDLCSQLKNDARFEAAIGADGGPHSFRQCLLDQCWPTFERLMLSRNNDAVSKRNALGMVKLMAELILRGLVSPRLVIECSEFILASQTSSSCILDCLATLIMSVGSSFDDPRWIHFRRFEQILARMHVLAQDSSVSVQIRLILRDVLALRDSKWCRASSRPVVDREPANSASLLNLAKSALLAPEPTPPTPVPNIRNTNVIPLKKQLRADMKPARRSGTPADIPANATGFFTGASKIQVRAENVKLTFNPVAFHRELSVTLRQVGLDADVNKAVQRIAAQSVPLENQEKEFADLLTRASEMTRDSSRRAAFALAAGIAAAEPGVFDRNACVAGTRMFFREVYSELCEEVPKLPMIVRTELLPALRTVFHYSTIDNTLPESLR